MKIKSLLIIASIVAGLSISIFTAFMTYVIIDEPIGMKMFSKIALTVVVTLPMIVLFSYSIGRYLSAKVEKITQRLDAIQENNFDTEMEQEPLKDIEHIHQAISSLAKRLESSIKNLRDHNENLKVMTQAFAHDVRTPITIIQGYLEELEEHHDTSDTSKQAFDVIYKELDFMNELSRHAIAYISSFKQENGKEPIKLASFVSQEIMPLLEMKEGVSFDNALETDLNLMINRFDLKQTLLNLLHNANKFTHKGMIRIYNQGSSLYIEDSGIGLEGNRGADLFEPFVTGDKSKNRVQSGFGLGLSICKNLLEKNGFDIAFDEAFQAGARIIIRPKEVSPNA